MKKINKIVSAVLATVAAVVAVSFAGCGNDVSDSIDMNIDLSQKPELSILMPSSGLSIEQVNSDSNAKVIEEVTGYKARYTQLPSADASKTLNNELMDKRHYNAMKLTKSQFADLVKDDMLVDITDALPVFGPDLLENISEESWDVVTVDGKIYGIPERASSDNIENPIVFNSDMMLKNNLDLPTTLEEFENVLKVLTEKLGRPAMTFDKYTPLVFAVSAAFGIYSEWQEYTVDGKTEVLYYMNAPRYKDYVDYMNSLYKKGYISQVVGTNTFTDVLNDFTAEKAGCMACSIWNVTAIVSGLQANGKITATEAAGTLENNLSYLRALKETAGSKEKVYRSSGYTYITAIPFYEAKDAGYALDWMNSKIKDTDDAHNFRSIVLGEENVHWMQNANGEYLPIAANFAEKDTASYYLTGSNEKKYTAYWTARVRKQPELYRAWSTMMRNADEVGVYNIVDFTPPITEYNSKRSAIEEYAQDQFYVMLKDGSGNIAQYLEKLNGQNGCKSATDAINEWYKTYKHK